MEVRPEDGAFGHTNEVSPVRFADDIQLKVYTPPEATGGYADTSFIDPPEDVLEAQNETPS